MAGPEVLRRRYRRLLWAYPKWYRRERGKEMLTTMLDAARPGQRRPAVREVLDVVVQGLRCRLRPPRGLGYQVVAVVVGLFGALVGWAVAGGLAVGMLVAPPSEGEAVAVAVAAVGQRPHNVPGPTFRCPDYCNNQWQRGGDEVMVFDDRRWRNNGVDHTTVVYWDRDLGVSATIERARQRLAADGWTIDDEPFPPGSGGSAPFGPPVEGFTAYQGNLALHVHRLSHPLMPSMYLTVEPGRPGGVLAAAAVAGAVAGLLAGWLTACWLLHRHSRHAALVRAGVVLFNLPILVVMVLLELFIGYVAVVASASSSNTPMALLPTLAINLLSVLWIPQAIAVAVVLGIAVAALPGPADPPRQPRTGRLTYPI